MRLEAAFDVVLASGSSFESTASGVVVVVVVDVDGLGVILVIVVMWSGFCAVGRRGSM